MTFSHKQTEEYEHYESYYFCNVIQNILSNQGSYMRGLNDYHGDGRSHVFETAFPKWSHFHDFIEFIIENIYGESESDEALAERLRAFKNYRPSHSEPSNDAVVSFRNQRRLYLIYLQENNKTLSESDVGDLELFLLDFYNTQAFQEYKEKTVREVFYLLFGNRSVLKLYNEMIAEARQSDWDPECYNETTTTRKGYLRRLSIPRWVQKAVYHRDKGRCVLCKKDLTGVINNFNNSNYDHIVPLARFGINDVTNIQLLCDACNQQKKAKNNDSSMDYFPWYSI